MKNPYYISVYKILEWCKILENVNQLIMTADQRLPGESMVGGGGWRETLERDMRKVLGFMDVFIILIVRMVSWGKNTAKLNQIVHFVPFLVYHFGLDQSCKNKQHNHIRKQFGKWRGGK